MNNIKLSVVIPAYNEAENIKSGSIKQVHQYLKGQPYQYEVIIVDDGSLDQTVNLINQQINKFEEFKLIKNPHHGKAMAVFTGLLQASGQVVVFTDMDQATPISEIEKFFPKFNQGYDLVIGSRHGRAGAPLVRKLAASTFAIFRNLILGLPFSDTQCGFKAFDKKAIEVLIPVMVKLWQKIKVKGPAVNAGFDVEVLFLARKMDLKIAEVDVNWYHVGTERVQIIRDAIEAIEDILRIKYNDISGKYNNLVKETQ